MLVSWQTLAFADLSVAFQEYFKKGVKAYQVHDYQEALRCFKIAQVFDSSDTQLNGYIKTLENTDIAIVSKEASPSENSQAYQLYLHNGIEAYKAGDYKTASHDLNLAIVFYPDSKEADHYLQLLGERSSQQVVSVESQQPASEPVNEKPVLPAAVPVVAPPVVAPAVVPAVAPAGGTQAAGAYLASEQRVQPANQTIAPVSQTIAAASPAIAPASPASNMVYVAVPKPKAAMTEIPLEQLNSNGKVNPKIQVELHSSLILTGNNIRRFLVVDEEFLGVKIVDNSHLEIDALRPGPTFLHIWDDFGRHSIYVEVVFPKSTNAVGNVVQQPGVTHSQPFKVTYGNDWESYYAGKDLSKSKRQSYSFNEVLGVTGETPYGFLDTSGSYTYAAGSYLFDSYTIGLSQIPVDGTSNFNLRGFDANRMLSPLTLPTTRLRGVFADVDLFGDVLGVSVSHGQEQTPVGFISNNLTSQFNNSYVDAAKLTLFPNSNTDRYSFNYATGYGSDRQTYLTEHNYSVEGLHAFNKYLSLNAEEGSDTNHDATLASLRWQDGTFKSNISARNIDKGYSTVSTLPSYQGETGVSWSTDGDYRKFSESTFFEAYRDRLNLNPNDSGAYNYDGNGHLRYNFTDTLWSDSDFNFMDTAGEISPMHNWAGNQRVSKSFGIWNGLKGTVFSGFGYQNNHSSGESYDRQNGTTGVQIPINHDVSAFANYEYDTYHVKGGNNSYPSVVNSGIEYQKQINSKLSFNTQVSYHDELGLKSTNTTFMSGERGVIVNSGLNYTPYPDMSLFADASASGVVSRVGNAPYDDFEIHVGMRLTFGGATYWDPLGTVTGIVYKDNNGDGKYNPGDQGIAGVKIKVGDKVVVTDKNGRYCIDVRAKGVDVYPVMETLPGGMIFSTSQNVHLQIVQGRRARVDFGLTSQTGIYGIVFISRNGSSVPNEGDQFIGKVKITLDGKTVEKSDMHGSFYFRKVVPGTHTIMIDINSLAINMVPRMKLVNKIEVVEGTNYMFNIPVEIKQAEGEDN